MDYFAIYDSPRSYEYHPCAVFVSRWRKYFSDVFLQSGIRCSADPVVRPSRNSRGNSGTRSRTASTLLFNPKRTPQQTLAMRFSVPRSLSPSPARKHRYLPSSPRLPFPYHLIHLSPFRSPRKSGTFRAPSVSSDSEEDGDENSNSGSSSDASEPEILPLSTCAPFSNLVVRVFTHSTTAVAHHRERIGIQKGPTIWRMP